MLRRVNSKAWRTSVVSQLLHKRAGAASGHVHLDEYFGLTPEIVTSQGAQTSDISGDVTAPAGATITTGQGAQTTDAAFAVVSVASIVTGQGSQTTNIVATTPFVATITTGQGSQTSDIVAIATTFQVIAPRGWWDSANQYPIDDVSFWRLNPRSGRSTLVGMLAQLAVGDALHAVAGDAEFAPPVVYGDGFGTAALSTFTQRVIVPGISSDEGFGHLQVIDQRQYVSVAGVYEGGAGEPYAENLNRAVYPPRIDPDGVGEPTIVGPRYLPSASAGAEYATGEHAVIGPRYLLASGVTGYESGVAAISWGTRWLVPSGIAPVYDYVPQPAIANAARVVEALPPDHGADDMGWPVIGFEPFDVIWGSTAGWSEEFGDVDTDMIGPTRRIRQLQNLHPLGSYAMGAPKILPHTIHPGHLLPGQSGTAGIIGPEKFGKPAVSNWIRYIDLNNGNKGIAGSRYGTPWVSNWIRYLDPRGFDRSVVWWDFGDPLLAGRVYNEYDGRVEPDGLASPGFGAPTITIRLC